DVEGREVFLEAGDARDADEHALVERAVTTGQRLTSRGVVVKPVRSGLGRGILGVLVLRANTLRPWDAECARFLAVVATTVAAAVRDSVRRRAQDEELRRRARRSEEERVRATEVSLALQRAVL